MAKNPCVSAMVKKVDYITVYSPAIAGFTADVIKICSGTKVALKSQACGAVAEWELNWEMVL